MTKKKQKKEQEEEQRKKKKEEEERKYRNLVKIVWLETREEKYKERRN